MGSSSSSGSRKTSGAVSWTESSSVLWFESRLEYSCVSLAKLAMRCRLDLTRWQPDFPWWMARPRLFLHTFPQLQVTDPSLFVVDWAGRVDSMKSVRVSLSSTPLSEDSGVSFIYGVCSLVMGALSRGLQFGMLPLVPRSSLFLVAICLSSVTILFSVIQSFLEVTGTPVVEYVVYSLYPNYDSAI